MENQEGKRLFYYMIFHLGMLDNLINLQVVQSVENLYSYLNVVNMVVIYI